MCTPCRNASPWSISPNPSTRVARPARHDLTSVPTSTRPAATVPSMWQPYPASPRMASGADAHQTRLDGVVDVVVVPRLPVLRDQLAPLLLRHAGHPLRR